MASKHTHIIEATSKGFKKAGKDVKGLSSSMKKFATGLLSVTVAYKGLSEAIDSVKLAGKLEGIESAFNNMRNEAGFSINTFSKLDKALNGTTDKMTIMTQANNAMLLGIADSDDQMAEMFDVAQRLAQAVGQDATFGIESLVTGLGRQSKLMLDNLGIIVDTNKAYENYATELGTTAEKLTDAEKKQGFVNEAMRQGRALVDGIGDESLSTSQKLDQLNTSVTNFKIAVGEALIESGAIDVFNNFTQILSKYAESMSKSKKETIAFSKEEKELSNIIKIETAQRQAMMDKIILLNSIKEMEVDTNASYLEQNRQRNEILKTTLQIEELLIATGMEEAEIRSMLARQVDISTGLLESYNLQLDEETAKRIELQRLAEEELEFLKAKNAERAIANTQDITYIDGLTKIIALQTAQKRSVFDPQGIIEYNDAVRDSSVVVAQAFKDVGAAVGADAKTMEALTIAHAIADTYAGANKAFKQGGTFGFISGAGIIAGGLANVASIRQAYSKKQGQTGFEGVVDEPTQFTVGEGGAAEYVSVTPMEGVNNAGGGQGININISGNVMSQQFVEEELSERIAEAVRKGISFA